MRAFPDFDGPMAGWPRVETVPGIESALQALRSQYRLFLATNAVDSGELLVRRALERVSLAQYFEGVFTARELGARKPEAAFFAAVVEAAGCPPHEALMVGDDYRTDVAGAKQAGLRAVWFNPGRIACPSLHPLYDAEMASLAELPTAVEALHLPDVGECMALLAAHGAPPGVVRHSLTVAGATFLLACRLRALGELVDPLLAHRGGLLHDVAKIAAHRSQESHGRVGERILRREGYPVLARIVEWHMLPALLEPEDRPSTWEEKLVHYVDKLVKGDEVVSLAERIADLHVRYPEQSATFDRCLPHLEALEAAICARVDVTPEELVAWLGRATNEQLLR